MLRAWSKFVNKRPWVVIIVTLILIAIAGYVASGVFNSLNTGDDFQFPNTGSTITSNIIKNNFKPPQNQIILLFNGQDNFLTDKSYQKAVIGQANYLQVHENITSITGYYNTSSTKMVSDDGKQTILVLQLGGSVPEQRNTYHSLMNYYSVSRGNFSVAIGGLMAVNEQTNEQIKKDLEKAEFLSFPIVLILLLIIFGNVIAAAIPVVLGFLSIIGGLALVRILEHYTLMSPYVINVVTLLGLGLAIDYSLFLVGRFREELKHEDDLDKVIEKVMTRAGRTIMFSGLTVIVSFLSLTVFPQVFLHSVGLAGAAVIACAVLLANSLVLASLRILGKRVGNINLPIRRQFEDHRNTETGFWYRFSHSTMRNPIPYLLVCLIVLIVLTTPFRHIHFSVPDATAVPNSFSSKQVSNALTNNFKVNPLDQISIVLKYNDNPLSPKNVKNLVNYTKSLSVLSGVDSIDSYLSYTSPTMLNSPSALASIDKMPQLESYVNNNYVIISVKENVTPQSTEARNLVANIRTLPVPVNTTGSVGGTSASLTDLLHEIASHAPYALAIIFVVTIILIFFLTGGVLVPIKAVLLGTLSLTATFGLLVWVFQFSHLASFIHVTPIGTIDATSAVLIFAVAFGLSMDYEFFLLSRIKEQYDKTKDNAESIAWGVQRSAGIITSAAILLISVIGLFTIGKIAILQQIGLGLAIAVAIDASLIRLILVPTIMRLLGKANWWAPRPLAWLYGKFSIKA